MKRTAVSIILAVAALAMLASLLLRSRALPLEVHLSQNSMATEIERIREDFAALVSALDAARREIRAPGEAEQALLDRVSNAPETLHPLAAVIPASGADRASLDTRLESFTRSVSEAVALARDILAEQSEYAGNVAYVRDEGPRIIQQMRDLRLDAEANDVAQLVLNTLDHASPQATVSGSDLRLLVTTITRDEQVAANVPREIERLGGAVLSIVDHKAPLERKVGQLADSPIVQRATVVGAAVQEAYRRAVASVEQARLMLGIYSAALFLVLGFAAFRLQSSYRALNRSHAELAQLNESLEQRVAERTQKLADTLKSLKESQVQLVQAEKMSSLGQLVAGISHEINTPLLYLANNAVLIQERIQILQKFVARCSKAFSIKAEQFADRNEFQAKFISALKDVKKMLHHEDLESILQEAEDLTKDSIEGLEDLTDMAQSLKDFSRLDRAPVASFDVNSGLDKTLTIARNVIKHKAEVRKYYGDVPEIECSPSQINQVFLNLLTNAAQAIEDKGEIVITTKRAGADHVAISIADTGCGIPPEIMDKIRDPFFTTKEVGTGTGLGLSIVDEIVRSHNGRLQIESEVGRGSVFTVVLPIKQPSKARPAMSEEPPELDDVATADEFDELAEAV
ncbi:MAG TPA: ATP-binding protein [Gammaproteobacteria bacterium]